MTEIKYCFITNELKDTYKEKVPSNKTLLLSKITNIWVIGTSNQLFIQGS